MEKKNSIEKKGNTRRMMLKKIGIASTFIVPTIMTFSISELQAKKPSWSGGPGGNPDAPGQRKKKIKWKKKGKWKKRRRY